VAKLLLIVIAAIALANSWAARQADPPLLIDNGAAPSHLDGQP
jgi:hypothetical protein